MAGRSPLYQSLEGRTADGQVNSGNGERACLSPFTRSTRARFELLENFSLLRAGLSLFTASLPLPSQNEKPGYQFETSVGGDARRQPVPPVVSFN
jgi:hypothetical protein